MCSLYLIFTENLINICTVCFFDFSGVWLWRRLQKLAMPKDRLREEMVKILKNPLYTEALTSLLCPLDTCPKLRQIWYYCHYSFCDAQATVEPYYYQLCDSHTHILLSAFKMTYIVSGEALSSTHSLVVICSYPEQGYNSASGHFVWLVQSLGTYSHCTFLQHLHYQLSKTRSRHIYSLVPTSLTVFRV